jgi:hypothetical protein
MNLILILDLALMISASLLHAIHLGTVQSLTILYRRTIPQTSFSKKPNQDTFIMRDELSRIWIKQVIKVYFSV